MAGARYRLVFESFGVTAEVLSDDSELFERLPSALPPGWRQVKSEPATRLGVMKDGSVTLDGAEVARSHGEPAASLAIFGSVARRHLAMHAPAHVFIHAGVVSLRESAIIIPGRSHSGKTTLVDELVRVGATYYSDEYAVVDSAGLVLPYAKPLSIRNGDSWLADPVPVPDDKIATRPISAGMIVVTYYEVGGQWCPTIRTRGEGGFALLQHTLAMPSRPADALAAVSRLARNTRMISGPRGEASEVVQTLVSEWVD